MSAGKVKELKFQDLFCSGLTLIAVVVILVGITGKLSYEILDITDSDISTEDELATFHDTLIDNEYSNLACVAFLWFSAIIGIVHISYITGVIESFFTSVLTNMINNATYVSLRVKYVYIISFILFIIISMVISGIFLFLASYYNWEFTDIDDATSYVGYYIQLLLIRGVQECFNSSLIWMGIIATLPWITLLFATKEGIKTFCCNIGICGNKICIFLIIPVAILIVYLTVAFDVFDWSQFGFFSVSGGSEYFGYVTLVLLIINGLWLIILSCKMESVNKLIEDVNSNTEYTSINYSHI